MSPCGYLLEVVGGDWVYYLPVSKSWVFFLLAVRKNINHFEHAGAYLLILRSTEHLSKYVGMYTIPLGR